MLLDVKYTPNVAVTVLEVSTIMIKGYVAIKIQIENVKRYIYATQQQGLGWSRIQT